MHGNEGPLGAWDYHSLFFAIIIRFDYMYYIKVGLTIVILYIVWFGQDWDHSSPPLIRGKVNLKIQGVWTPKIDRATRPFLGFSDRAT